jgi:TolB-like protein
VLGYLLERPGELVRRQDLQDHVWGALHVNSEQGLNNAIRQIRQALGDDAEQPRFLETLPRSGYRFVATVEPAPPDLPPQTSRITHRLVWSVLGVSSVVLAIALMVALLTGEDSSPVDVPPRLAILPFENLSDPTLDPYRSVLAEELITRFASLDPARLQVISRGSVRGYETSPPDLARVARELAVDYVVEGSVRLEENRTILASRLVRVRDGASLWSGRLALAGPDAASGTKWLTTELHRALSATVLGDPLPSIDEQVPPTSVAAWEAYLEGQYRLERGGLEALAESAAAFERAVSLDAKFAPAHLGLAEATWRRSALDPEARQAAQFAADEALALDPSSARAHLLRAEIAFYHQWDRDLAEQHYAKAIALGDGLSEVHSTYGFFLVATGAVEAALREAGRARDLDPISALVRGDVGLIYLYSGRPELALPECQRTLDLEPGTWSALQCLVDAHLELNQPERAAAAASLMSQLDADQTGAPSTTGRPIRNLEELRTYFEWRVDQLSEHQSEIAPGWLAAAAARAGRSEQALDWLAVARQTHSPSFLQVAASPTLKTLRTDPRFGELVAGTPIAQSWSRLSVVSPTGA